MNGKIISTFVHNETTKLCYREATHDDDDHHHRDGGGDDYDGYGSNSDAMTLAFLIDRTTE